MIKKYAKADVTRNKIIKSARKLFVENGFNATSIHEIARDAEINHSLIIHHFDSKLNLWARVKKAISDESIEEKTLIPSTNLDFPDFISVLVDQSFKFYLNTPDIIKMINWQRMEFDGDNPIDFNKSDEAQHWVEAFKYYQKKGAISLKLKPKFIVSYVLSVISSAALDMRLMMQSQHELNQYITFCKERLLASLK